MLENQHLLDACKTLCRGPLEARKNLCWARDSAADLWLSGARQIEKAVGRQGGDAAASRGIRPRQGVARFEISGVQTLLARLPWVRSASAFASPTGYRTRDEQ